MTIEGNYLKPTRSVKTNYLLEPGQNLPVEQPIEIPGNFGKGSLKLVMYDVVDTADPLMDYQRFFEQPFVLTYHIPDELSRYFQEPISFPPLVDGAPDFDTEFSRLLFLMMAEGKTAEQIASDCKADLSYVQWAMSDMAKKGYFINKDGEYSLAFPVITHDEAVAARQLAEEAAIELASLTESNRPAFLAARDGLVEAGRLPPNADDFTHGGSILYYGYPTIAVLFYWLDLGQRFIEPDQLVAVFQGTDLCRVRTPRYMYAVHGGAHFNGTNFYHLEPIKGALEITFGDSIPDVWCIEGFEHIPKLFPDMHWSYSVTNAPDPAATDAPAAVPTMIDSDFNVPEPFVIDTVPVMAALKGFDGGTEEFLQKYWSKLKLMSDGYGEGRFGVGMRYWFWNIVASRAQTMLIEKGFTVRHGNGRYRLEEL
jgi:hypothetical protein